MSEESPVLDFGSDLAIRHRWFTPQSMAHPAKLHLGLLQWIVDRYTQPGDTIADPMAGVGSVLLAAAQQRNVIAREIEPRWLAMCHENAATVYRRAGWLAGVMDIQQADARQPWGFVADHVVFSPPYACATGVSAWAMKGILSPRIRKLPGTHHERWDYLARNPTPGSIGALVFQYGEHPAQVGHLRSTAYWDAMHEVYSHAATATRGSLVLIIKDHIKDGKRVPVADETVKLCRSLGFILQERHARRVWPLSLWQRRRKERGEPVIETEDVLIFRRPT